MKYIHNGLNLLLILLLHCGVNATTLDSLSTSSGVLVPIFQNSSPPMLSYFRHIDGPDSVRRTSKDAWDVYFLVWADGRFIFREVAWHGAVINSFPDVGRSYYTGKMSSSQLEEIRNTMSQWPNEDAQHRERLSFPFDSPVSILSFCESTTQTENNKMLFLMNNDQDSSASQEFVYKIYRKLWGTISVKNRHIIRTDLVTHRPKNILSSFDLTFQVIHVPDKTQKPDDNYIRGVWLTPGDLGQRLPALDNEVQAYRQVGMNTVYVDTWYRGTVPYFSKYAQISKEARECIDFLRVFVTSAKIQGMRVEAWAEYGFYAGAKSSKLSDDQCSTFGLKRVNDELLGADTSGSPFLSTPDTTYTVLCPVNPKSQAILVDLLIETMSTDGWDGLHLDRIRFANAKFCHCSYCKQKYLADTGFSLEADLIPGHSNWDTFAHWRREQINRFMATLSERFRAKYPNRTISAAVVLPDEMESRGQYWTDWLDNKWVDYVVPLTFSNQDLKKLLAWVSENSKYSDRIVLGLNSDSQPNLELMPFLQGVLKEKGISYWHWGKMKDFAMKQVLYESSPKNDDILFDSLIAAPSYKLLYSSMYDDELKDVKGDRVDAFLKRADEYLKKYQINYKQYVEPSPVVPLTSENYSADGKRLYFVD